MRRVLPEVWLWVAVFGLNFLLFWPIFYFLGERSTFFPIFETPKPTWRIVTHTFLIERSNLDIFRFQVEWFLLVGVWLVVKPLRKTAVFPLLIILYLLQFLYMLYEAFVRAFYLLEPTFFTDYILFSDMTNHVIKNLNFPLWVYVGAPILLLVGGYLLYKLFQLTFFNDYIDQLSPFTRGAFLTIGLLLLGFTTSQQVDTSLPISSVSSVVARVTSNNERSLIAEGNAERFDKQAITQAFDFSEYQLAETPNIYLIFVESYGSVLYKRSDFHLATRVLMRDLDAQLAENEWAVASHLSNSPTWGGGSWIAYTSALSGIRIETHAEYLSLLERYHNDELPHLINYLGDQGYESYRFSPISRELDDLLYGRYKQFYGFDHWIRFREFGYDGPLYGWGPSPSDQYTLNFARDTMLQTSDAPHVFFFITQNSHYPWDPLPPIVEDWTTLELLPLVEQVNVSSLSQDQLRRNYIQSIEYEMSALVDFIVREGNENDIFVLIGDHQPARVARRDDGYDTPIHIISQNHAFVNSFFEHDFLATMNVETAVPTLHHEGFYTLFMRGLLQSYGENPTNLPPYEPTGLQFAP